MVMNILTNCTICGSSLSGRQKMFCSVNCKNKSHQSYQAQKKRGINRKLELVRKSGGACSICGYKKNLSSLTFHHSPGSAKEFNLDTRSLSNRTLKKVIVELKKCQLVCNNCHAELHNPSLNIKDLS